MSDKEKMWKVYRYWIVLNGEEWSYVGKTGFTYQCERSGKDGASYKKSPKFYKAIQDYGFNNFNYEVMWQTSDEDEAYELEKMSIELLDSIEHGFNTASGGRGAPGYLRSEQTRKRISDKQLKKTVFQLGPNQEVINQFSSSREAARVTGICQCHISEVCNGKRKTAGGYSWSRTLD